MHQYRHRGSLAIVSLSRFSRILTVVSHNHSHTNFPSLNHFGACNLAVVSIDGAVVKGHAIKPGIRTDHIVSVTARQLYQINLCWQTDRVLYRFLPLSLILLPLGRVTPIFFRPCD